MNKFYLSIFFAFTLQGTLNGAWTWKKMLFIKDEEAISSPLALSADCSLTIEVDKGSVTVKVTDDKPNVSAIKKGAEEELPLTTIEVQNEDNHFTIKSRSQSGTNLAIDYIVSVPKELLALNVISDSGTVLISDVDAPINVTTKSGSITIKSAQKSVRAQSERGTITIDQELLPASSSLFIETMNENIKSNVTVSLPKRCNADIKATTLKGMVTSSMPITLEPRTLELTKEAWERMKRNVYGRVGSGGAPITIDVARGNIHLTTR